LFKESDGEEEVENANLAHGDQVRVLDDNGNWHKVEVIKNGATGYIHTTHLSEQ